MHARWGIMRSTCLVAPRSAKFRLGRREKQTGTEDLSYEVSAHFQTGRI